MKLTRHARATQPRVGVVFLDENRAKKCFAKRHPNDSRSLSMMVVDGEIVEKRVTCKMLWDLEAIKKDNIDNKDLFYVIALFPHQLPGKADPRRWHCWRSRDNAAARMRRHVCFYQASANADAKERSTV